MSENEGGAGNSFEERLRAARTQAGARRSRPDAGDEPGNREPVPVGDRVAGGRGAGLRAGRGRGDRLGAGSLAPDHPALFLAIFVLLGGAAGMLNVWRLFAPRR